MYIKYVVALLLAMPILSGASNENNEDIVPYDDDIEIVYDEEHSILSITVPYYDENVWLLEKHVPSQLTYFTIVDGSWKDYMYSGKKMNRKELKSCVLNQMEKGSGFDPLEVIRLSKKVLEDAALKYEREHIKSSKNKTLN